MTLGHDDYRDPVARRFDNLLALGVYALLISSIFTFWLSALIGAIVAYACRGGADPLTASHYRFQIKVFWIGVAIYAFAVIAGVAGGGATFSALLALVLGGSAWTWQDALAAGAVGSLGAAVGLFLVAIVLWFLSCAWTALAALWGGFQLVRGRPMGESRRQSPPSQMRLDP